MEPEKKPTPERKQRFIANSQYFTLAIYVVITFAVCLIVYNFINNWHVARGYLISILSTLSPFLIAALIAYFINPIINMIDRVIFSNFNMEKHQKAHKFLSLLLAYILFVGAIVLVLAFVMPQIILSLMQLVRQMSTFYYRISKNLNSLNEMLPGVDLAYVQDLASQYLPDYIKSLQSTISSVVPMLYDASLSIIGWIINIILAFVISCYIMSDRAYLKRGSKRVIYALFSEETSYKIIVTVRECNSIFSEYLIAKAVDSLIIGFLCFILMCILKLPYAVLISLIVGITNMIPYFGPFIGAVPGAIILLITSPMKALIFLILIIALQQFDGVILGPRILGNSTGLPPIWIIFAITVGGAMGGWIGMFVGVPVVAVLTYLGNNYVDFLLYKKNIQPDLSNINIPEINNDNVFVPKGFVSTSKNKKRHKKSEQAVSEQKKAENTLSELKTPEEAMLTKDLITEPKAPDQNTAEEASN